VERLLLGCPLLLATIASAWAADMTPAPVYTKAPAVVPPAAFRWSGFYLGVNGGYGWGEDPVALSSTPTGLLTQGINAGVLPSSLATNPQGGVAGGQVGWNYQMNSIVLGLEADMDWTGIKGNASSTSPGPVTAAVGVPRTVTASQSLDWLATFRARLGYTPVDRWLVYVTGGGAAGHANISANFITNDVGLLSGCAFVGECEGGSASKTLWGWAAGVGAEVAVGSHWTFRGEYLHYDLGSLTAGGVDTRIPGGQEAIFGTANFRGDIVRGAVNFKFD
jgi:outer membrane immunogenic protein